MSSRIEQLRSFLAARPDDPFVVYALAIEYKNGGNSDEAAHYFAEVYRRFPEYVPTYLHYGLLLDERSDREGARRILTEGMAKARAQGDNHALSELADALSLLDD